MYREQYRCRSPNRRNNAFCGGMSLETPHTERSTLGISTRKEKDGDDRRMILYLVGKQVSVICQLEFISLSNRTFQSSPAFVQFLVHPKYYAIQSGPPGKLFFYMTHPYLCLIFGILFGRFSFVFSILICFLGLIGLIFLVLRQQNHLMSEKTLNLKKKWLNNLYLQVFLGKIDIVLMRKIDLIKSLDLCHWINVLCANRLLVCAILFRRISQDSAGL